MRIEEGFQFDVPALPPCGAYASDPALQSLLARLIPPEHLPSIAQELHRFSRDLRGPISERVLACDGPTDVEPKLTQYDNWGRRVDRLWTSEGWRALKRVAAEEGLAEIFYARREGAASRLFGFAKTYIWSPDARLVGCPMAMTDGAARILELLGTPEIKDKYLSRLISRNPDVAYTAGQWMTERPGGSSVADTETTAVPLLTSSGKPKIGDAYALSGFKWFSSATDGDVAVVLARTGGPGNSGLSLFLVPMRDEAGQLNGIRVHRLKNKFGTKTLPTAELQLSNTVGYLLSPPGRGVASISPILNITRVHSAVVSVSGLRRALDIAAAHAQTRQIATGLLAENALHTATLARVEVLCRALLHLVFGVVHLLGLSETGRASEEEEERLRLLTPVVKAFAAGRATGGMEECLEACGGQGYMEETGIGRLIRDCMVERVWEGTQNVLALDMMRVLKKSKGRAMQILIEWAAPHIGTSTTALGLLHRAVQHADPPATLARPLLNLLGHVSAAASLGEHVAWVCAQGRPELEVEEEVRRRWVEDMGLRELEREVERVLQGKGGERDAEIVYGGLKRASKL